MKNLRELTTYASLQELSATLVAVVGDGKTAPPARPEGERAFVRLHKTARRPDPYGNKGSEAVKEAPHKKAPKDSGFPPDPLGGKGFTEEEEIDESGKTPGKYARAGRKNWFKNVGASTPKQTNQYDRRRKIKGYIKKGPQDFTAEETEIDEAAGIARSMAKSANPLIKRPKFDAHGNVVLTKDAKRNIAYGKAPRSRKLTGTPYSTKKAFGEDKEEIDEAGKTPGKYARAGRKNWFKNVGASTPGGEKRKQLANSDSPSNRHPSMQKPAKRFGSWKSQQEETEIDEGEAKARSNNAKQAARGKKYIPGVVKVSPKGYKGAGKVREIHVSQYDPKKHSLAEEDLNEKNWIQNAIKKPGALTAAAHRAKKSVGEFAREHKHSGGKVGKRARLALTLKKINKEETEQLDELSKPTLARYVKQSATDRAVRAHELGVNPKPNQAGKSDRQYSNRWKGHDRAVDRLTKEETIDELKKETLARYIPKAAQSMSKSASRLATGTPYVAKPLHNVAKRQKGIERASERLGGTYETGKPLRVMIPGKGDNDKASGPYTMKRKKLYHGEETQIDELSKPTLDRYTKTAAASAVGHTAGKQWKKVGNRLAGINKSVDRLQGHFRPKNMYGKKQPKDFITGYRAEETEIDEGLRPRTLAAQEWRTGCMSELEEKRALLEEDIRLNEGGPTKSHFKMAAETIKAISDEGKRKEHASVHADLYSKQNPRFDRGKFMSACNVKEETKIDEVSAPGEETWIKHRKGEGGFQKRYGDRWKNVLYATAWKRSKHNYPKG
jgi:hypothetical protein